MDPRQERQNLYKTIASVFMVLALVFLLGSTCRCQEQYIRACQQQAACQLDQNVSWGAGVRTYVFTPMQPNVSLRIWIHNNNPTSAHTAQTLNIWVTDSTTANFSLLNNADQWVQGTFNDNSRAGAQCLNVNANAPTVPGASGKGTCYASGMYAAQIAVQFTPGGNQAGNPDTFDIGIVQQPSNVVSGPAPGEENSAGAYNQNNRWVVKGQATGANTSGVRALSTTSVHIADCVMFTSYAVTAPAAASTDVYDILDDVAIVWEIRVGVPAAIGQYVTFTQCGLGIRGTVGNSMSCKVTNATANVSHSCALIGFDLQVQ